ncbi:hypothetical protein FBQ82_03515 [Anaerolineae bacterium CFX7]|nr:hypothetical protein [Anaerolineae bacterium CFX7]
MKFLTRAMLLLALVLLAGVAASQTALAAPRNDQAPLAVALGSPLNAPAPAPNAQGCSGSPSLQFVTANPSVTVPGQVSTISWGLVGNASAAFFQWPNGNRQGIGTPGSQQVNPTQTTTYFIVGVCGNNQVQWPITVTVQNSPVCSGTPQITSFTANPTTINNGQSSTLSWGSVNNADNVQLSSSTQGGSGVPTPGSVVVAPNQTTTYFLTAWCQGVSAQAQVQVTVNNPPPPPPPPSGNQVTSVTKNGGLSNANSLVVSVGYFWNGEDAPATLQARAFNNAGNVVGTSNGTRINPNQNLNANLNFTPYPPGMARVSACIIGSSGTELACHTVNMQ